MPVIGAYAWLDDIGAALVSEIAQEQAFAPASELAATIAIIGVIVVLLMGVLIYIASRRIAGPILSITETAVAVRGGDLSRMAPVRTHDEVGVLAETFNQMTGQLRENVETLERRVDERTAELATQKAYFEALVEISPAAVVTMDLDQNVTGWNPAATTLFGYRPEEAIGRSIDDLVLGSDEMRAEGAAVAQASLATGRHDLITRRSRRDGSIVDVEVVMVPLVVDGQTVGSYVVYHDITELQAARLEADRANEAKSAFLATMSHEIRTPMNAIIGMSGLLAETDLDDEQQEYAGIVQGSSEALLAIINDILDFSKIEAGRMDLESVEFSLRDCIESSLDLIGPLALRKGLDVAYQMPPEAPDRLVGDPNRVRQILINLLSNAVKFTETGHVRLSVAAEQPSRAGSDASISISVTDTGIGLTEEQVGRLFESFSQADISTARRYGGTGLGLAISRRLAELMGGELHVRSPGLDGHGSTFQLTIPAVVAAPPEAVPDFLLGRRVLVAEPSSINRGVFAVLLEGWGAEVVLTDDLARDDTPPSVDVVLIGCGTDTASDALARVLALRGKSATPVVLSSAAPRRDVLTDPRWGGVAFLDWVSKPIKPAALAASMGRSLGIEAMPESDREADDRGIDEPAARPMAILLAEDNALNQKLAVTLLTRMGHVVTVADNGRSAVDLALGEPFDLILMDIQMPDMDGLEATRRIIDALGERRPRIVALTANALSEDRGATEAAGMDDYLAKPLRRDELARVLRDAASSRSRESAIPDRGAESAEDDHRHDDDAIDAAAFRAKVSEMVGAPDPEFERELISEFLDGLPALVASIETAGDTADADLLRRACHTLKSHAAIFGAARLEDQCRRLEALAGEGGTPQGLIADVVTEARRVEVLVRRLA